MSNDIVENIHIRIKEELERSNLKMSEASRLMGYKSSQGLRDVVGNRKKATAELISRLGDINLDVSYILWAKSKRDETSSLIGSKVLLDVSEIEEGIKSYLQEGDFFEWFTIADDVDHQTLVKAALLKIMEAAKVDYIHQLENEPGVRNKNGKKARV